MNERFFHLLSKAQSLDEALRLEQSRRAPDTARLWQLARTKRRIKDRLARLMGGGRVLRPA